MKTLANILTHESLPKRYNREYSDNPTISAQKNLEGRTHFVDPQTLKFHGSRVLSALPVSDGAFFKIIETTADRKSTRLNSSHSQQSRMPSSA